MVDCATPATDVAFTCWAWPPFSDVQNGRGVVALRIRGLGVESIRAHSKIMVVISGNVGDGLFYPISALRNPIKRDGVIRWGSGVANTSIRSEFSVYRTLAAIGARGRAFGPLRRVMLATGVWPGDARPVAPEARAARPVRAFGEDQVVGKGRLWVVRGFRWRGGDSVSSKLDVRGEWEFGHDWQLGGAGPGPRRCMASDGNRVWELADVQ
jgi:hypothetical protein